MDVYDMRRLLADARDQLDYLAQLAGEGQGISIVETEAAGELIARLSDAIAELDV